MSKLVLIPTPLFEGGEKIIEDSVRHQVQPIRYFAVENLKTARRVLRKYQFTANFDEEVYFFEWDKHQDIQNYATIVEWLKLGVDIGLMSEAGLPCIADPGNEIVALAHQFDYQILPLSGPSSIVLALISSGLGGQNFAFNGYLPIDKVERKSKLKMIESRAVSENQTQIFMETPYRNQALWQDMTTVLSPNIRLSFASNIGADDSIIHMKKISEWRKVPIPAIHKVPTVFCIGV